MPDACEDKGDQSYNYAESLPSAVLQPNGVFKCSSCGVTTKCARTIKRHVSEHVSQELVEAPSTTLYRGVCQKKPKKKLLHQQKHSSSKDSSNPWRSYVCKECGDTYTTSSLLNLHRVQVHRTYKCLKCGLVLIGRRNFSQHVRKEHPGLHISKVQLLLIIILFFS